MAFDVAADAYDRFMGRYSARLAPQLAELAGVVRGQRVLDVGCGPGALTAELVARLGAENVAAVDPSSSFVAAAAERHPGVDVRRAAAEELPFDAGTFDAALAQLVVQFMADPLQGVREMARVTRAGGVVAACVWDVAGAAPMTPFWHAVRELELTRHTEDDRVGTREGDLARLFADAGLDDVRATTLVVHAVHPTFDEWWEPFTLGVGPAGSYYQQLEPAQQAELEARLRERMGDRIELDTRAWTARGTKGV